MATYSATLKDNRMTAIRDLIDLPAGDGYLEIGTTGMALPLVKHTFSAQSGTISGAVLTFSFAASTVAATATGIAAAARIRDANNTDIITGLTVGTGSEDIVLDSTSIDNGQDVTLNSATITHAA